MVRFLLRRTVVVVAPIGFTRHNEIGGKRNRMPQSQPLEERLPLSTAILSNVALVLVMWNVTLRLALLVGRWAAGAPL